MRACWTCIRINKGIGVVAPTAVYNPSDRNYYCTRHRCCVGYCTEPRDEQLLWWCVDHTGVIPTPSAVRSDSRPSATSSAFLGPQPVKPGISAPPIKPQSVACLGCGGRPFIYTEPIQVGDNVHYCRRHRCTHPGCAKPRANARHDAITWTCEDHRPSPFVAHQPGSTRTALETASEPPVTEPPVTEISQTPQRHSRVRSLFSWKTLLSGRKGSLSSPPKPDEPPPSEILARAETILKAAAEIALRDEASPHPDPGWHQCHVPACQERVLSEEVWVCQKHLDQGFFDIDDPPGYVDCPVR